MRPHDEGYSVVAEVAAIADRVSAAGYPSREPKDERSRGPSNVHMASMRQACTVKHQRNGDAHLCPSRWGVHEQA